MVKRVVIALGGNAFIKKGQKCSYSEQMKNIIHTCRHIARLAQKYRISITHGNGPQVGNILLQQDFGSRVPMYVCGAQSQGQIGYMIQEALYNSLHKMGIDREVVTVLTQVIVDKKDPAFLKPTKQVGPFYRKPLSRIGWKFIKTPFGFRRVVPSPEPLKIVEEKQIKKISRHAITISCGGGGIPVFKKGGSLSGVDAVIDKDKTSAILARSLNANYFAMLTDIDNVYLNFRKKNQKKLRHLSVKDAKILMSKGHFPPGTMAPKINAAISFAEKTKGKSIIAKINNAEKALELKSGTVITK